MKKNDELLEKLAANHTLSREEWLTLIKVTDPLFHEKAAKMASDLRDSIYGKDIYIRGLIEFTNICKNDCYYCGIRKSNQNASRYRLTKEEILSCCQSGYGLGFRTFVLQGGEDAYFTDEVLIDLVSSIHCSFPDCAITLSLGERSESSYQLLFEAGADRYLLRHETASDSHYSKLHPASLSLKHRKDCLLVLKKIGYQTGCGFMVGSPFQTAECIVEDFLFIHTLQPEMVGIGPFIPHHDTPFADYPAGSVSMTLYLLSLLRLMLPNVLLPATTALGTLDPMGREKGILAGANVLMPNLSPGNVRNKYLLYDNKICTGEEAAECKNCLTSRINRIGYTIVTDRGDYPASHI